jgi:hypothetical protein
MGCFRTVARNPTITFDVMNGANPTDPCAKNVISFLVFEKPPTPPYETTSKPFQIETARIHAIDQSSSSLKIFPLGRTSSRCRVWPS